MNPIPEFTETELWTVRTALSERYGKSIALRLADSELQLNFKVGESKYRSQFFTATANSSAPGRDYYDNLAECVTILLQVQADHERSRNLKAATR